MSDEAPELYQLIGAALRDVAQARFMADTFSKQISFLYERDGILRHFPVPRVDIDEAELTLFFQIKEVAVDENRHSLRNSAIGALFDQYSVRIVREAMQKVRDIARQVIGTPTIDDPTRAQIEAFQKRFLSDENRDLLSGRLLQYFNESVDTLVDKNCVLDVAKVMSDVDGDVNKTVFADPSVVDLKQHFDPKTWADFENQVGAGTRKLVEELSVAIGKLAHEYPDYRITVDPNAAAQAQAGAPISSIKIKSSVRNYKWSKVDVDNADLRNVRTLTPE